MKAVIVGSTGLVGSALLEKLLADSAIEQVISVSRKPLPLTDPKLVDVRLPKLEDLPRLQSQLPGNLYFCCLGTTIRAAGSRANFRKVDRDAVIEFGKIAKLHNAKSLSVITASSANTKSIMFYSKVKGEVEEGLKALDLRALLIYRPGLLLGARQDFRLGETIATKIIGPISYLMREKVRRSITTEAETLAIMMLTEAKRAPSALHVFDADDIK